MSSRSETFTTWLVGGVAGGIGLTVWIATMATAPRYSYGSDEDLGNRALWWVLLIAAVIGGFLAPRRAALVGALLGFPGTLLSPWTAPRGDNDGLWLFIVPAMAMFTFMLMGAASAAALVRVRLDPRRRP